jgi:hypothetical protein
MGAVVAMTVFYLLTVLVPVVLLAIASREGGVQGYVERGEERQAAPAKISPTRAIPTVRPRLGSARS